MSTKNFGWIVGLAAGVAVVWIFSAQGLAGQDMTRARVEQPSGTEVATFAGGCFWCIEADLEKVDGVVAAISGFSGGSEKDPTYKEVAYGRTTHLETVQIFYDPKRLSYEKLVDSFFRLIDPTDASGSFVDRGPHYRSAIFYHSPEQKRVAEQAIATIKKLKIFDKKVATEIRSFKEFYPAENYHQDFYKKSEGRYRSYRSASGRDRFIKKTWRDVPPLVEASAGS